MAAIVSVGAGERGRALCSVWAAKGNHTTSEDADDLAGAAIVLYGDERPAGALRSADLTGKIVVDCRLHSAAEPLAARWPEARIVKAFNALSAEAIAYIARHDSQQIGTVYPSGFYCGDDARAKAIVAGLIAEVNLDPIDCGPLSNAPMLESLGLLVDYLRASTASPFTITLVGGAAERSPLDLVF